MDIPNHVISEELETCRKLFQEVDKLYGYDNTEGLSVLNHHLEEQLQKRKLILGNKYGIQSKS